MESSEAFDRYRPLLFSIAYRMLSSVMDAEDMVQETFLRWQLAAAENVQSTKAYLTTIITRLCIDHLRSARVKREEYVGPWLPEPLFEEGVTDVADTVALSESISMAFLVLLESLTPVERAVYLLHEVFDYDYGEIAQIVDKNEANCRQIVRRAKQHIVERRPRFDTSPEQKERLLGQFFQALEAGDMDGLLTVLADDITLWSDGGGKVSAARRPIHGAAHVARFLFGLQRLATPDFSLAQIQLVNGQPGFIVYERGQPRSVFVIDVVQDHIQAIRVVVNPEKLRHVPPL